MPARWMEAKKIKQRRERRAWSRPFTVKSGIIPNRGVIQQYQATAKGLGLEEAKTRFPNVAPGKHDINERIDEIIEGFRVEGQKRFDDPLFITVIDNTLQRCRVFFNSQKTCFILQHVSWKERVVRISISYANMDRAQQVWVQGKVTWRVKRLIRPLEKFAPTFKAENAVSDNGVF